MGIKSKLKSLGVPQTKILEFSFSTNGHFFKWPKRAVSPSFLSGNIANIIPGRPLKKMMPLMEDHGGCMGTPVGLWTIIYYIWFHAKFHKMLHLVPSMTYYIYFIQTLIIYASFMRHNPLKGLLPRCDL